MVVVGVADSLWGPGMVRVVKSWTSGQRRRRRDDRGRDISPDYQPAE
jgi:hypothetical protein